MGLLFKLANCFLSKVFYAIGSREHRDMTWEIEYVKSRNFVKVVTGGVFNLNDYIEMAEDILSREFWRPGLDVLFDYRKADFSKTTFEVVMAASRNHQKNDERIGGGKSAILMKSRSDYGLGRQFEMVSEGKVSSNLYIFLDEREALEWLLTGHLAHTGRGQAK
jgi:hypothetical protein